MAYSVTYQADIWSDGSREPIHNLDIEDVGRGHSHIFDRIRSTPIDGDMARTLIVALKIAATFMWMVCYKQSKGPSVGA